MVILTNMDQTIFPQLTANGWLICEISVKGLERTSHRREFGNRDQKQIRPQTEIATRGAEKGLTQPPSFNISVRMARNISMWWKDGDVEFSDDTTKFWDTYDDTYSQMNDAWLSSMKKQKVSNSAQTSIQECFTVL